MTSPSYEIAEVLENASIGTRGASSGWGIFVNKEPTKPDTCVTIYDTPSRPASPKFSRDFPGFQIRVRAAQGGESAAHTKMAAIRTELLGKPKFTLNSVVYVGVWQTIDLVNLGYDDSNRLLLATTWRAVREPPASGNRS